MSISSKEPLIIAGRIDRKKLNAISSKIETKSFFEIIPLPTKYIISYVQRSLNVQRSSSLKWKI